jgi:4-diphosphocytidyl-2-C-methyl-D-erythritol kinase
VTLPALTVQTPAKINPVLEVLGKRPDGYHELSLVFQSIGLYDELSFWVEGTGVRLEIPESPSPLACDSSNLATQAGELFLKEFPKAGSGVRIRLKKRIPLAAGLGGGSSDAAAVLWGLDRIFGTHAGVEKLQGLAARLGSDVPFFLHGGTALGTGRGEKITPWAQGFEAQLVLVKPAQGLSTAEVYSSGGALVTGGEKVGAFKEALLKKDLRLAAGCLFNGLEGAAQSLLPEIAGLKKEMQESGAWGVLVSGSGPTVFGIAESPEKAEKAAERLKGKGRTVFSVRTIPTGIQSIPAP